MTGCEECRRFALAIEKAYERDCYKAVLRLALLKRLHEEDAHKEGE